ncbi:MAG: hypothetical protein RMK29_11645 [Myxococcales bacterium]|nr:hypothetical protein [Myxococcota bacterium]MDW8282361.1 hypothetical protein [Myxococcales bacterium]
MRINKLLLTGALSGIMGAGCFPTYVPGGPAPVEPESDKGPATSTRPSTEPVAVRPPDPARDSSMFLDQGDATRLLDLIAREGTPDQTSRMHACMKMRYDTLGRVLASRGVNMGPLPVQQNTTCTGFTGNASMSQPARFLYCDSRVTLGLPQYPARIAESPFQTAASAVKMHDLFLAAASEVVAAFGPGTSPPACRINGQPVRLFEANHSCNRDGVACLLGFPPGDDLLNLCNQLVLAAEASGGRDAPTSGKQLAVAAILAVAHMCE